MSYFRKKFENLDRREFENSNALTANFRCKELQFLPAIFKFSNWLIVELFRGQERIRTSVGVANDFTDRLL